MGVRSWCACSVLQDCIKNSMNNRIYRGKSFFIKKSPLIDIFIYSNIIIKKKIINFIEKLDF